MYFIGKCFIGDNKTSKCKNNRCAGIYWNNDTKYRMLCASAIRGFESRQIDINTFITPIVINNVEEKNENTFDEIQMVTYQCEYKECNSRNIADQIRLIVQQQYDRSPIRSILNYIYKEPTIKTTVASTRMPFSTTFQSSKVSTVPKADTTSENIMSSTDLTLFSVSTINILSETTTTDSFSSTTIQEESTNTVQSSSNFILTKSISTISQLPKSTTASPQYPINSTMNKFTSIRTSSEILTSTTTESNSSTKCFNTTMALIIWILLINFYTL